MTTTGDDIVHARAAGIDISKKDAKVCIRIQQPDQKVHVVKRTFAATRTQIRALRDWLIESDITSCVMESTSTYWISFYDGLCDAGFEVILANASRVKQLRGRKTDLSDAEHLARLAGLGMVAGSFIPSRQIRDLRLLTRTRARYVAALSREWIGLEKLLEDTGCKLSAVASKLKSVTGKAILTAIASGVTDPQTLAGLSLLHADRDTMIEALNAEIRPVHQVLIRAHLDQISASEARITTIEQAIASLMVDYQQARDLLCTIPGIKPTIATTIIAEIGVDMTIFPTPAHLASWAGVAPGINESAGKRKPARARKGNPHLKAALTIVALVLVRRPDTRLGGFYQRIRARHGHNQALVATARALIVLIWRLLSSDQTYQERPSPVRPPTPSQRVRRLARAETILQQLGIDYTINTPH